MEERVRETNSHRWEEAWESSLSSPILFLPPPLILFLLSLPSHLLLCLVPPCLSQCEQVFSLSPTEESFGGLPKPANPSQNKAFNASSGTF